MTVDWYCYLIDSSPRSESYTTAVEVDEATAQRWEQVAASFAAVQLEMDAAYRAARGR